MRWWISRCVSGARRYLSPSAIEKDTSNPHRSSDPLKARQLCAQRLRTISLGLSGRQRLSWQIIGQPSPCNRPGRGKQEDGSGVSRYGRPNEVYLSVQDKDQHSTSSIDCLCIETGIKEVQVSRKIPYLKVHERPEERRSLRADENVQSTRPTRTTRPYGQSCSCFPETRSRWGTFCGIRRVGCWTCRSYPIDVGQELGTERPSCGN